ncbi:MAG: hypothetical protein PVH50_12680 [Anaerolineae bacterium]
MTEERNKPSFPMDFNHLKPCGLKQMAEAMAGEAEIVVGFFVEATKVRYRHNQNPIRPQNAMDFLHCLPWILNVFQDLQAECGVVAFVGDHPHMLYVTDIGDFLGVRT